MTRKSNTEYQYRSIFLSKKANTYKMMFRDKKYIRKPPWKVLYCVLTGEFPFTRDSLFVGDREERRDCVFGSE